jgi:DNA-binding LytR/AlgR family response regulator
VLNARIPAIEIYHRKGSRCFDHSFETSTRQGNNQKRQNTFFKFISRYSFPRKKHYLKADGSYTDIYLNNGSQLVVRKKLIEFEKLLPPTRKFFRSHRSFLVNLRRIKQFVRGDGGYLMMENDQEIPISREKKTELSDALAERRP